ncbi:MAG: hypothetical protein KGJ86_01810 [Chloroflexota bacterium]|nr:hypothetical protein [Chloroflexota bacterium]
MRWFWQAREQRVREDVGSGTLEDFYWGRPASGTEEDYLWRRLSDNWYQKDVIPSTYLEIHNECYEAYNANPLAFQVIEITTSMVLGSGVKVVASNRRVQAVIDRFWNDPDNHMHLRTYSLCTELALYGEQFIRFFVNPFDGAVKIGQIDPSTIDEIYSNPENVEQPLRFHQRPLGPGSDVWTPTAGAPPPEKLSPQSSSLSTQDGRWFEAGTELVQFAINKVSNAKRGHSDLATLLPWLRRYTDWLTDRVRLNKYKGAFLWDVKLLGADKKTIDRKRAEYAYPPEPGSIVVHNESEEWSAVEPKIGADDVEADGRAIKLMIAVGAGLPEHYLSEGGNVNRATAMAMGLPTFKRFQRRQDYFGFMLRAILDRAIDEAIKARRLPAGVDRRFEIVFPAIDVDDAAQVAAAFSQAVTALGAARDRGWVSDQTAMRLMYRFLGEDGLDVTEELDRARKA